MKFNRVSVEDHDVAGPPCEMCERTVLARTYYDSGVGTRMRLCPGCFALVAECGMPLHEAVPTIVASIRVIAAPKRQKVGV